MAGGGGDKGSRLTLDAFASGGTSITPSVPQVAAASTTRVSLGRGWS